MLMEKVAASGPWAAALAQVSAARKDLPRPEGYYDLLRPLCSRLDIWHTHYYHVMENQAGVVEWFKGSSLRPFYSPLEGAVREKFLAAYTDEITHAYSYAPRMTARWSVKFPRLFILRCAARYTASPFDPLLRTLLAIGAGVAGVLDVVDLVAALEIVEVARQHRIAVEIQEAAFLGEEEAESAAASTSAIWPSDWLGPSCKGLLGAPVALLLEVEELALGDTEGLVDRLVQIGPLILAHEDDPAHG